MSELNRFGQPVGYRVDDWVSARWPSTQILAGRWCRVAPLDAELHSRDLYAANAEDADDRRWTYLPYGPFVDFEAYRVWVEEVAGRRDPLFFAISDSTGYAAGVAAYQRIDLLAGTIEVGHLCFSSRLQGTTAATEAMMLMMRLVFEELGFRRCEWKCDALNMPSRRAAERLGFSYEGTFRQATVVKGRNRDTAWFALTDKDWQTLKPVYEQWLDPSNFNEQGLQRRSLLELTRMALTQ
ncbi:GNAT family protein [Ferrimicrobium sp.]|uniref:GNAT family N-acetyltransferase n=1 Tax=Ferrimicrobium sp. TaxID=2926050 RepID=UPI002610C627|nr:GNAT family protein [Ferrimicrobium sp.]